MPSDVRASPRPLLRTEDTIRAVSLAVTLVFLGWIDGGFLSVSHITSGIWRGPSVYFDDLALLLMVTFTVIATVFFGRVFCGFLCPFGALQDLLDSVVPTTSVERSMLRVSTRRLGRSWSRSNPCRLARNVSS